MNCPNCQGPLREGAQFCTRCGARTVAVSNDEAGGSLPTVSTGSGGAPSSAGAGDSLAGRVLDGKYEIVSPLGSGGMGAVYRARRVLIGDEVAVKVLHSRLTGDEKLVERFRREARAAAQLHHPNVVTIHDYGEARGPEGFAYIVMELVRGESLRDILRREGRLAPARAVSLMRDVCAGVGAAHRRGIVHRDIKPDNIIVTPADEDRPAESVKVVDFGIAKLRDLAAEGSTLTEAGMMVGTLFYMSPEQCKGEPLDSRADVYSLGAMLHEMLAGAPPFTASNITSLIFKHVGEPPPPLPEDLPVTPALRAAVLRALSKEPDARPSDASEFAREIQAALTSAPAGPNAAAAGTAPPQEPFFPATAHPVPVTPSSPPRPGGRPPASGQDEVTVVQDPSASQPRPAPAPRQPNAYPQRPHAHAAPPPPAAPPRPSRKGYVVGLLFVVLVSLGALGALGVFLYTRRDRDVTVNVNARPTPTPARGNTNANASPTPTPLPEAMQIAEVKIIGGSLLSPADLSGMTAAQLGRLRNTVYARHGRTFQDNDLRLYFQSRSWYKPRADYDDGKLTSNDRANADLLKAFEDNNGAAPRADAERVAKDVGAALKDWAESTRERKLDEHMSHYADVLETYYKRQNVAATIVRADRNNAFTRYDQMEVRLDNIEVTPDATGLRATAAFDKTWEFDSPDKNSKGSVRQQLNLIRAGGRWLITGEKDLQVYYTNTEDY
ncbi:MAG TPA: protein kinase [Pyrinomonadaceae bacterium]|jgi:serine/threonine-protein kinase